MFQRILHIVMHTNIIKSPEFVDEDYIHASYVNVSNDLTYICAQGPLVNTIQDFWIMALQEETKVSQSRFWFF